MIGSTYFELKLLKNPFKTFSVNNNRGTRKVKDFLTKKFTLPINPIVLNTTNLSNSCHGPNFLEGHHDFILEI